MSHFIYTMKGLGKIYPPDQKVFEDVAMWDDGMVSVTGVGEPERIEACDHAGDAPVPLRVSEPQVAVDQR